MSRFDSAVKSGNMAVLPVSVAVPYLKSAIPIYCMDSYCGLFL